MSQHIHVRVESAIVRSIVPQSVFRQSDFKVRLQAHRGVDIETQQHWIDRWPDRRGPHLMVVTAFDQLHAEYAAAWLTQIHMQRIVHHSVLWISIYDDTRLDRSTGGFRDPVPRQQRESGEEPTLLVLTNLTRSLSYVQAEKVRDVTARYSACPVLLVGSGPNLDPASLARRALVPIHSFFHIVPQREVINVHT